MEKKAFTPERKQYSIVLLGNFNPEMFQPEWFRRQNIISEEDADFARNQDSHTPLIVSPQITVFRTSQMTVQIENRRFEVKADKEPLITLIDFITKTFENLGAYNITAIGFNYIAHYKVESEAAFHIIGDKLAPKKWWETLLQDEVTGENRKSGLASMQIKKCKEDSDSYILFTLQVSPAIKNGLMLNCNDHNVMPLAEQSAEYAAEMIGKRHVEIFKNLEKLQMDLLERVGD